MNEISLRAAENSDAVVFFKHQRESEALEMTASVPRDRDEFFSRWDAQSADATILRRTILFRGRAAGYVASFMRGSNREVCYWLGREFWGQGLATRGLALFLDEEQRRPLYARVLKRNPASLRVLTKNGFAVIGEDVFTTASGERAEEFVTVLAGR